MSGEENAKPVNVDPKCIQEALRMYLQPIKNDDPQVDFYTMYKRETMEYDTEYMQKYNEDLNTTLIFAGLFSAVSSAFVIDVQSKLEPDSGERSEAYLRAILLSLNRSIVPDEDPATPPAWNGPPTEIITTSNLLYASLLMSLLAAFVAMLGKQWLNRYLRHTGGSMIERCGDRQRKFDGLKKWPFRLFVEGLPIMLQVALLLLTCGLSRYMWSINTSVARIIISFTVLGFLFYIGIVAAGTSSYECPFQTPASEGLRHLRNSATTRKLLARISPINIIFLVYTAWRNAPKFLAGLSPPSVVSLIYAAWMDAWQGLVTASHHAHDIRRRFSWQFSLSGTLSGIFNTCRKAGHQAIIVLLRIDRAIGNTKQRLIQRIRRLRRAALLPIAAVDLLHRPHLPLNGPGLRVPVRNLEALRERNANNARCVCWALWNITDPEAIDSAIRLAGNVRWFDGNSDHNPPYDLIVSTFEACFDATKQLYPGMRDRAYFSARAILRINTSAKLRSRNHASKYPIPTVSSGLYKHNDSDFYHIIQMLECNAGPDRPTADFPKGDTNTPLHLLWMSNLFVDFTRIGPHPALRSYKSYLSIASANHRAAIANTLVMWYMSLGGRVEEETFWAIDKSDSLEVILPHLSTKLMDLIGDGHCLEHLRYLVEFLVAWEKRPVNLTSMAYQWCCAIPEAAAKLGLGKIPMSYIIPHSQHRVDGVCVFRHSFVQSLLPIAEDAFSIFGYDFDRDRVNNTPLRRYFCQQDKTRHRYTDLLHRSLKVGFRLVEPDRDQTPIHLDRASPNDQMFEAAFSSGFDDCVADAVCAWIADPHIAPPGSFARYFTKRVKDKRTFSRRLQWAITRVIGNIWRGELKVSGLETVRLLNHLEVNMDDVVKKHEWKDLLVSTIRSTTGQESLSSHHWHSLDKLLSVSRSHVLHAPRDVEVMKSLEEAEGWEKLEVWMVFMWEYPHHLRASKSMQDVEQTNLNLLSHRPSAISRFEDLVEEVYPLGPTLRQICDRARAEQLLSEPPLISQSVHIRSFVPLRFAGDDTF